MTTLLGATEAVTAMREIADMVDLYHETAISAINQGTFEFEEHVGVWFTPEYTEVVDGVRGDRSTLRGFWDGVAQTVQAEGAKLGPLPMTYYIGRHLADDYVLTTASVPVSVEYGDGRSDRFFYVLTLLARCENGKWRIDHTHRETRQSV